MFVTFCTLSGSLTLTITRQFVSFFLIKLIVTLKFAYNLPCYLQSVPINVLENYDLTSMTLEYRRECRQSNLLESLTTSSETLAEDSNSYNNRRPDLEFTHLLRMLADKAEIVRARTKWHSKKKQQEWYDLIHVHHQLSLHAFFFFIFCSLFFIFRITILFPICWYIFIGEEFEPPKKKKKID